MMKPLGLSKQINIIALLPAFIVGVILSVYFTFDQLSFIEEQQIEYSTTLLSEIEPLVVRAITENDITSLDPILRKISSNQNVNHIKISDTNYNNIVTAEDIKTKELDIYPWLHSLLSIKPALTFKTPVYLQRSIPQNPSIKDVIANIEVQLNTNSSTKKKLELLTKSIAITLFLLLLLSLIALKFSKKITIPLNALSSNVRDITAGNLETQISLNSIGELGLLENCMSNMKNEIKNSREGLQLQLNNYTDELQQTLEELEIRNAELDITRSRAIGANNAKSEFLANMSHEIRTPLSGIIGFTELLQGTILSAQQKDYSATIQKSAKHLLDIINDVLDLSKIESGKTDIIKSDFSLIDIIEDIITLSSTSALEKNIELIHRIESNIPSHVHSDPFRTHQILTNLIGNAIKFTDSGYVYLQVSFGEIKDVNCSIKFTVSDTGIGMSADDKSNLFKAFSQADTSITRRFGGTGLGLIISRKLVELMYGEMGFDSTKGEGSTFWFSIPVKPIENDESSELQGKRIAFFSNNFIAKQSYKSLFHRWGCNVIDYNFDDTKRLKEIEKNNDVTIIFLGQKEINNSKEYVFNDSLEFSNPSLLIGSTQSLFELKKLQNQFFKHTDFNSTALTAEKTKTLKHKIITLARQHNGPNNGKEKQLLVNEIDWSNINIMVVDDNDVNLRLTEILLRNHKAQVTTASSGEQAIDYASKQPFDIIFMDLHMPGLDGYETTSKIRELDKKNKIIIIALTANAMPQEKHMIEKSGMNGILIKPISEFVLQKIISQWVLKSTNSSIDVKQEFSNNHVYSNSQNQDLIFSIDLAKKFTSGNETLAYELFAMLQSELPNYTYAIKTALHKEDISLLYEQAHKLHGASRCCGTIELKEASSLTESLIKQEIDFDIEKQCDTLLKAIQNVADYNIAS